MWIEAQKSPQRMATTITTTQLTTERKPVKRRENKRKNMQTAAPHFKLVSYCIQAYNIFDIYVCISIWNTEYPVQVFIIITLNCRWDWQERERELLCCTYENEYRTSREIYQRVCKVVSCLSVQIWLHIFFARFFLSLFYQRRAHVNILNCEFVNQALYVDREEMRMARNDYMYVYI